MREIRDVNGRKICEIDEERKRVQIKNKGASTTITFLGDEVQVDSEIIK